MTSETLDISNLALHRSSWLSTITQQLIDWDYSEVTGSGQFRGHDKFALLDINISKNNNHQTYYSLGETILIWSVDPQVFPDYFKEVGLPILKQIATFFIYHLQAIKGERIPLRIEITRAGFGLTDDWGKACSGAMFKAIISCFDAQQHAVNKKATAEWFTRFNENRGRRY